MERLKTKGALEGCGRPGSRPGGNQGADQGESTAETGKATFPAAPICSSVTSPTERSQDTDERRVD